MDNLKRMKKSTLEWAKEKQIMEEEALQLINEELDFLEQPEGARYDSIEMRDRVKSLESARKKILFENEERWHLKCREFGYQ